MPSVRGVDDDSPPRGYGVSGQSDRGYGVIGASDDSEGVRGESYYYYPGVYGSSNRNYGVRGLANITGGSFTKLPRLNAKVRYDLDGLPAPTGIFRQIQVDGGIDSKEMYRTFNMGVGFCVVAPKSSADDDDIINIFAKYKMRCKAIGMIEKGRGEVAARIDGKKEAL
jgi:phosphoribosylaminoimidazole (AIR) synthetase